MTPTFHSRSDGRFIEIKKIILEKRKSMEKNFKLYGPFLWMGLNCLKATEALWGDNLLLTTN